MRRLDKQISDPNLIEEIFQKGTVVHIAMLDGDKPYQVPLNYGYENNILYIHSARAGKKSEKRIIQGDTLKMQEWMRFNISANASC